MRRRSLAHTRRRKKTHTNRGLFLIVTAALFSCFGSSRSFSLTHVRGFAYLMPYHIQIGRRLTRLEKEKVEAAIARVFGEIDACYNHWNPNSELSQINEMKVNHRRALSGELGRVLALARDFSLLTEGRFDPTLGAVIRQWKTHLMEGKIPDVQTACTCVSGWENIEIFEKTIRKKRGELFFDLDGMIKGFAIDALVEALCQFGYRHLYVNWAGDLRVVGPHPSGRPWRIQLPSLRKNSKERSPLFLSDSALATSGDYMQWWQIGETIYSHIVDPQTKKMRQRKGGSLAAVTVQAPTCALADALATAAMTFDSADEVCSWIEQLKRAQADVDAWALSYGKDVKK